MGLFSSLFGVTGRASSDRTGEATTTLAASVFGVGGCVWWTGTAIALWLCWQHIILGWIVGAGILALGLDVLSVFQHNHKSVANEIVMFIAICLSTLFVYSATTGELTTQALGLWALNSLFFSSAVFSVKLRKKKTSSLRPAFLYHGVALAIVTLLYAMGWLSLLTALVFSVALLKIGVITCWQNWYRSCRFEHIARFETYFALSYTALAALTVLPAKLSPPT